VKLLLFIAAFYLTFKGGLLLTCGLLGYIDGTTTPSLIAVGFATLFMLMGTMIFYDELRGR